MTTPQPAPRIGRASWALWVALAAVLLMAVKPYYSYDVWHHIRCGWHAWNHGPARFEPFSCTGLALKLPWLQYEWLAQALIYLSHEGLGVDGTVLVKALLCVGAFALLALACRSRGCRQDATAAALVFAALGVSPRFFVRPEVFSNLAFGFLLWAVERSRGGRTRLLWALPAVFAVWANMHGAYVAGWVLLAVAAVAALVEKRLRPAGTEPPPARLWFQVGVVGALCVLAVCLNPYGVRILEVPFELSYSPAVRMTINEWKPYTLDDWLSVRHLFIPLVFVVCLAGWPRTRLADGLVLLIFGYLAVDARRHVSLAAFVTAPIVADRLTPLFAWLDGRPALRRAGQAVVVGAAVACVFLSHDLRLSTLRFGIDPSKYPQMAGEYLAFADIRGNLFNEYADGNYLMWRRYPHNLVFIDGRIDMYGKRVMRLWNEVKRATQPGQPVEYFSEAFITEGWRNILRRFDIAACVVRFKVDEAEAGKAGAGEPPTDPLVDALWADTDWKLVFWDDIILVFMRHDLVAGRYVYRTRPDTFQATRLQDAESWRQAVADLEHRAGMGKAFDCVTARVSLANALQAKGRFEQALPHLRRGLDLQPHEAARAYNLAACLLRLNRIDEAERFFREALRLGSKEPEKTWNGLGYCYLERRDWPGAVRCFRRAVQANPRYVFAHLSLSLAHERQGDRGAALEAARRAVEADPTSAAARERLEALERARPR